MFLSWTILERMFGSVITFLWFCMLFPKMITVIVTTFRICTAVCCLNFVKPLDVSPIDLLSGWDVVSQRATGTGNKEEITVLNQSCPSSHHNVGTTCKCRVVYAFPPFCPHPPKKLDVIWSIFRPLYQRQTVSKLLCTVHVGKEYVRLEREGGIWGSQRVWYLSVSCFKTGIKPKPGTVQLHYVTHQQECVLVQFIGLVGFLPFERRGIPLNFYFYDRFFPLQRQTSFNARNVFQVMEVQASQTNRTLTPKRWFEINKIYCCILWQNDTSQPLKVE